MFKKMLVASAVLAATTSVAFASHRDVKGERDYKGEKAANVADVAPVADVTSSSSAITYVGFGAGVRQTSSYKGLLGNVFAGYGKKIAQDYYLGGEIFSDLGSASLAGHAQGNRSTYGLGASIIPGMMLTNSTMAYGRVGLKTIHYTGSNDYRSGGTHGASQLGAGLQTALTQNWDARAEYVYTGGGVFHNFADHGSNQINLGLVYKLS